MTNEKMKVYIAQLFKNLEEGKEPQNEYEVHWRAEMTKYNKKLVAKMSSCEYLEACEDY